MKLSHAILGVVASAVAATGVYGSQAKAEEFYVPLLTYRTGAFAGSGIPIADGMSDYLTMLNERDGGIGGVKLVIEECETGYNTQKGVECYEATKGKGALVYNPYSTGITLQLIPKAAVDGIPVLSMAYGLSAAADGETFPWVFNPPATYWDGASAILKYIAEQEGGFEALEGKTLGYIFLDAGYGREPIPLLEQFAERYGFKLTQYPVAFDQMQNQSAQWLNVRRDRPDWMIMWGWGAMNPTAVKEAAKIRFPMDRFVGVWWSGGEDDARPAGDGGIGFKTLNWHGVGSGFSGIDDIVTHVYDKGLSDVSDKSRIGENLYNRGVYNSILIAEAIRTAQEITGKTVIDAADMRKGLENLNITAERWKEIGFEGFAAPIALNCREHSGHHKVFIQRWTGETWEPVSDFFEPMSDVVRPLLQEAAQRYISDKPDWQTQECSG